MAGIVKLYNTVIAEMDDDDDFTGTVYGGPTIVRAMAGLGEDYTRLKSAEHPNLLRAMVELRYLRVRIGAGDPHLLDLFNAVLDKIRNNEAIKALFGDRISAVDDPNEPSIDGLTAHKPWLGLQSKFIVPPPQFQGQRDEELAFNAWIYHQRFPKQMTANVLGE